MKKLETTLTCVSCGKDTVHEITYAGEYLKSVQCKECGYKVEINQDQLMEEYKEDFVKRILTKPKRMTKELEEDYKTFFAKLPRRLLTKPKRIAKEVKELKQID